MASYGIQVGDTIKVSVIFRHSTDNGDEPINPDAGVTVTIRKEAEEEPVLSESVSSSDSVGEYFYDWTPMDPGVYEVEFIGSFSDGEQIVIAEVFEVVSEYSPGSVTLVEDQEFVFATDVEPLLVDPEEFSVFYSDANAVEIVELVHRYSTEVIKLLKGKEPTLVGLEYIRAAVLCSLSRVYDYGGGDATSLSLGDLKVSHQVYPRNKITRANAANWCELAAALRQEMLRGIAGMRAVSKGTKFRDPMPERHLREA